MCGLVCSQSRKQGKRAGGYGRSVSVVSPIRFSGVQAMTGISMEITGMAAVQKSVGSSSVKVMGKAAVENDGSSVEITGKATAARSLVIIGTAAIHDSLRKSHTHMIHFTTSACVVGTGVCFSSAVMLVRFVYLWQQCLLRSGESSWSLVRASLVLGTEVGLLSMAVLLILLVPRMIVTWTTALVFEYILGMVVAGKVGKRQIVQDGTKNAKEISWITLTSVFEEGNAVAAGVLIVCFTTTALMRQTLSVG